MPGRGRSCYPVLARDHVILVPKKKLPRGKLARGLLRKIIRIIADADQERAFVVQQIVAARERGKHLSHIGAGGRAYEEQDNVSACQFIEGESTGGAAAGGRREPRSRFANTER